MPLNLWVIDKEGVCIRKVTARPGLKTAHGVVSRVSGHSVWTLRDDGTERQWRVGWHLPPIYKSYAPKG